MSIDVSVRLFFPIASAPAALRALAKILHSDTGKAIVIALPDGGEFALPIDAEFGENRGEPRLFEVGTPILGGFDSCVTAVVRKKKKLPRKSKPHINAWGDIEYFKVVKQRVAYPVSFYLDRDQNHFAISFHNITSADVSEFYSKPFRSRLAYLYSEGNGVAGVYELMEQWQSFADPHLSITLPEGFDEDAQGIDALVEVLTKIL
ncbi:hypothetical protein SAMN05444166_3704 [Singulisphaera sp. GP187]|uniref:hypothetical protein n=1 Tax=Singulisphaera sp. GP187 TaxID=1882752 RepID=UPI0009282EF5|nr:hypothetical protein [Singulisphaera sp. GP187]SIO31274.1 hypothetical protein SAMN05444166_3704 [Singulisphaera sp. GP187]